MNEEAQQKRHYSLFTVSGAPRMALKLRDEGISIAGDRLYWRDGEVEKTASLTNVREVRLQIGQVKEGTIGTCCMRFGNGAMLTVSSASEWGFPDEERGPVYADFLKDLHGFFVAQKGGAVRFFAGVSELRHKFAVGAVIVAGVFFVVLPIGLLLFTGELEALYIAGGGLLFVYPAFRSMQRNTPGTYSPQSIPEELLP